MTKILIVLSLTAFLASCSGGSNDRVRAISGQPLVTRTANGPISRACLTSNRKARNRALCGCIQAAADRTLSTSDQTLASTFYADPHRAQTVRQSDRASDEVFWKKYRNYSETAQALCSI
jgi:hypothetical protein